MSGNDPLAGLRAADFWEEQGDHSQEIFLAIARLIKQRLTEAGVKDDGSGRKYATVDIPVSELIKLGVPGHLFGILFGKLASVLDYRVMPHNKQGFEASPGDEIAYITVFTYEPRRDRK